MRMIILRVALGLLAVFTLVGWLIRARPYDDSAMRTTLLPAGCDYPCFMGVRPGVTSLADGLRMLEQHEWVQSVSHPTSSEQLDIIRTGTVAVTITWNGRQPDFLVAPVSKITFTLRGMHIQSLSLPIKLSLADFWLFTGATERASKALFSANETVVYGTIGNQLIVTGTIHYDQPDFLMDFGPSLCDTRGAYMVSGDAVLIISGSNEPYTSGQPDGSAPSLRYLIGCNAEE